MSKYKLAGAGFHKAYLNKWNETPVEMTFNSLADVGTKNHKGEEEAKAEVLLLCISLL